MESLSDISIHKLSIELILEMEVISKFNSLNVKKILELTEMEWNKAYPIDVILSDCIELNVEDHIFYLPKRFNSLTDEMIQLLSNGRYTITKKPSEGKMNSTPTIFEFNTAAQSYFNSFH